MTLRVVPCVALASLALPVVLRAQAMTEYAVQSSARVESSLHPAME